MKRESLIDMMLKALRDVLADQGKGSAVAVTSAAPLVGPEAIVTSMGLVSFISDVESLLAENHGLTVSLVSEQAFSRKSSPFRTVETLADYILELAGAPQSSESWPTPVSATSGRRGRWRGEHFCPLTRHLTI